MNPAILIVDDEQSICSALKRTFRQQNFQVFSANSGSEALDLVKNNRIDVIVSDQQMPGMTGTELFSIINDKHPHISRIMLSGHCDSLDPGEAVNEANINHILKKPWQDEHLIDTVNNSINRSSINTRKPLDTSPALPVESRIHYKPSYAISSLIKETYQLNLDKDIQNDRLLLSREDYHCAGSSSLALSIFHAHWPAFPNFQHHGILNMARQAGYLHELFTWYVIKTNESFNKQTPHHKQYLIDLFFDSPAESSITHKLLMKLIQSDTKLIFRLDFSSIQKGKLDKLLEPIYKYGHSLLLNLGNKVIDTSKLASTPARYIEMSSEYASISNPLLTEKRLAMLKDAQNMGIKTILSKEHSNIQHSYARSMGFDYF